MVPEDRSACQSNSEYSEKSRPISSAPPVRSRPYGGFSFHNAGDVLVTARQPLANTSATSASVLHKPPAIRGMWQSAKSLATFAATTPGSISIASGCDLVATDRPRSTARLSERNSRTIDSNPSRRAGAAKWWCTVTTPVIRSKPAKYSSPASLFSRPATRSTWTNNGRRSSCGSLNASSTRAKSPKTPPCRKMALARASKSRWDPGSQTTGMTCCRKQTSIDFRRIGMPFDSGKTPHLERRSAKQYRIEAILRNFLTSGVTFGYLGCVGRMLFACAPVSARHNSSIIEMHGWGQEYTRERPRGFAPRGLFYLVTKNAQ